MNTKKLLLFLLVCIFASWSFAAVDVNLLAGKVAVVVTGTTPPWISGNHSDPAFITDNDEETWWVNNNGTIDQTLTFELDEVSTVNSFRLLGKNYSTDRPKKITILVSETDNADKSFTAVVERTTNFKDDMIFTLDLPAAAKYIRLLLTMNSTWDCMAINDFKALGRAGAGPVEPEKPFVPVVLSGFNKDLIAENTPSKNHTNAGADDDKWVFYTTDVRAQGGLPSDGTIISTKGVTYKLADYGTNNVLWNNSYKVSPVLNFVKPIKAKAISLLMTAANGDCSIENGTINYDDGTTSPLNVPVITDWGSGSSEDYAVAALGRIKREKKNIMDMTEPDEFDSNTNFSLFESRIETDPEKTIKSITIKESTGNYLMLFAISAIDMSEEPEEKNTLSIDAVSDLDINMNDTKTIITNYSLGGAMKAENFGISVIPENNTIVTMTDFYNDEAAGTIEMELKGVSVGSTPVKIKLTNGNFETETSFTVAVQPINTLSIDAVPDLDINMNDTKTVTANYSLGGALKAENFEISVTPTDNAIVTTDFHHDEAAGTIEMELKGVSVGSTPVKIKLTNGNFETETSFTVAVQPVNTLSIDAVPDLDINMNDTKTVMANYSLGGALKAENFEISVAPADNAIVTTDFHHDEAAGTIEIELKSVSVGSTPVKIKLTNGNFETETSFTVSVLKPSQINDEEFDGVSVYPNPVDRSQTLYITSRDASLIQIYSLEGILLLQQQVIDSQTEISMNNISAGTYFLIISGKGERRTSKIIVK